MTTTFTALTISTTGDIETVEWDTTGGLLTHLQAACGGYVETVNLADDLTLWLNEDGIYSGAERNVTAEQVVIVAAGRQLSQHLIGDAVVTGGVSDNGDTLPLTPQRLAQIRGWFTP